MAKTKTPKASKGPQKETKVAADFNKIISEGESPSSVAVAGCV